MFTGRSMGSNKTANNARPREQGVPPVAHAAAGEAVMRLPQGACATGGRQSLRRTRRLQRMWVETMATLGDVCYAVRDDKRERP